MGSFSPEEEVVKNLLSIFGRPANSQKKAGLTCNRVECLDSLFSSHPLKPDRPCPHGDCKNSQAFNGELLKLQNFYSLTPNPITNIDQFITQLIANPRKICNSQIKLDAISYIISNIDIICLQVSSAINSATISNNDYQKLKEKIYNCCNLLDKIYTSAPYFNPIGFEVLRLAHYGS